MDNKNTPAAEYDILRTIAARRAEVSAQITELTARRRGLWEQAVKLNNEIAHINRQESALAKEFGFLCRLGELGGNAPASEAAPEDESTPLPSAEPQEEQPSPDVQPTVSIPERGEVKVARNYKRAKIQLCGQAITARRYAEGLSYKQLARLCGVGVGTLHNIIDYNTEVTVAVAEAMARALGCTVEELQTQPQKVDPPKNWYREIGVQ